MEWLDMLEPDSETQIDMPKFFKKRLGGTLTKLTKDFDNEKPAINPRSFSHYCEPGDCHCSALLPGADHPVGCIRISCEYYQPATD